MFQARSSPLHAARAGSAGAFCLALGLAALLSDNPVVLGGVLLGVLGAGAAAQVAGAMRRSLLWALPLALTIALVNALVSRQGLTVVLRLGQLPGLGRVDITLEALAYGGVLALRALALVLCGVLFSVCVDPDEMLRGLRRYTVRSALTATLATRLVPVLARDGRRMAEAQRCRPGRPPSRLSLARALTGGALDRALDVAAALELRGYARARRTRGPHRPWSRHDLAFTGAAAGISCLALFTRLAAAAPFAAYPQLRLAGGALALVLAGAVPVIAALPFLDRRGIVR